MRSTDARLEQAEKPVDGLRMHVPVHVDAGVMVDSAMGVAALPEPLVDLVIVREHHRTGKDVLACLRLDCRGSTIRHDRSLIRPFRSTAANTMAFRSQ